jgi:hypothetical protein
MKICGMFLPSFFIFSLRLFTYIVWFGRMSIMVTPPARSEKQEEWNWFHRRYKWHILSDVRHYYDMFYILFKHAQIILPNGQVSVVITG